MQFYKAASLIGSSNRCLMLSADSSRKDFDEAVCGCPLTLLSPHSEGYDWGEGKPERG